MPQTLPVNNKTEVKKSEFLPEEVKVLIYRYFWIADILTVILIIGVGYVFFLMPKFVEISSGVQVKQLNTEFDTNMAYANQLREIRKIYDDIDVSNVKKVNDIVESNNDKSTLENEFNTIVIDESGHKAKVIPNATPQEPAFSPEALSSNKKTGDLWSKKKISKTKLEISNLTYGSLIKILKRMETNKRIMDVVSIDYDPTSAKATLEVLTYQGR